MTFSGPMKGNWKLRNPRSLKFAFSDFFLSLKSYLNVCKTIYFRFFLLLLLILQCDLLYSYRCFSLSHSVFFFSSSFYFFRFVLFDSLYSAFGVSVCSLSVSYYTCYATAYIILMFRWVHLLLFIRSFIYRFNYIYLLFFFFLIIIT